MPVGIHDEFLLGLGDSNLIGYIQNRGRLTFPSRYPATTIDQPNVLAWRPYIGILLLATATQPNIPYRDPQNVDVNKRLNPKKYFLGRYSVMWSNYVVHEGFINYRNIVIPFYRYVPINLNGISFRPTFGWADYQQIMRDEFDSNLFDRAEVVNGGEQSLWYTPNYEFRFDLNEGVLLKYGWF